MGKIVMSGPQNVSLDGGIQDPDGEEGFKLGGWFVEFGGKDLEEWNKVALEEALRAEAWLLGRRSYEFFGARWRPRSGELADRLNSMPKYVVSSTLEDPEWNNTTVLKGDVVSKVSKLKQGIDGEIHVPASYQLARTLFEHDLVDELRLVVFPSSGTASASSPRRATRNPCAWSITRPSVTDSPSSPTSSSEQPDRARTASTLPKSSDARRCGRAAGSSREASRGRSTVWGESKMRPVPGPSNDAWSSDRLIRSPLCICSQ